MLINHPDYLALVTEVNTRIAAARARAIQSVNNDLVVLYWEVGRLVDVRSEWGNKFIDNLSRDIRREYPGVRGFSVRNIKYMQKFARMFPEPQVVRELLSRLTWYHNTALMDKVVDRETILWYVQQAVDGGWSRNVMVMQIERRLYERQAVADKTTNFEARLPAPQGDLVQETLKDPYIFDFIEARTGMVEREIESELVKNITSLLLELGTGFAFVGEQYHVELEGEDLVR